jgi:glutaredoxin
MKYLLKSIILKNCPYSIALKELLDDLHISSKYINVTQETKYKYKTNIIDTFPQVYIINNNNNTNILLGGYSNTKEIIEIINLRDLNIIKSKLKKLYPQFDNKIILRIIEIFMPQ